MDWQLAARAIDDTFQDRIWFLEHHVMHCLVGPIGAGYTVFPIGTTLKTENDESDWQAQDDD